MSDMKQKLEAAKAAYAQAREDLEKTRSAYESGAGKAYAEVKNNLAALKNQIAQHEQAHQEAQQALADAMSQSNGAKTEAVRKALSERRNAEDLIAECQALLHQAEENAAAVQLSASTAARAYQNSYRLATRRWAEMHTAEVLAEFGERLCAVLAVKPDFGNPWPHTPDSYDSHTEILVEEAMPLKVFVNELNHLVSNYEGDTKPYTSEFGKCDLGALSTQEIMSPAAIAKNAVKAQPA